MLGFNITADEVVRWIPAIAIAGVLIETTVRGIREEKKKQQEHRPQKGANTKSFHAANGPA